MPNQVPVHTLLPRQIRRIDATEGFRLEVRSGCLWLTRPADGVDHFLVSGSLIELHENQVLIECDQHPRGTPEKAAQFVLVPLRVGVVVRSRKFNVFWRWQSSALKVLFSSRVPLEPRSP